MGSWSLQGYGSEGGPGPPGALRVGYMEAEGSINGDLGSRVAKSRHSYWKRWAQSNHSASRLCAFVRRVSVVGTARAGHQSELHVAG